MYNKLQLNAVAISSSGGKWVNQGWHISHINIFDSLSVELSTCLYKRFDLCIMVSLYHSFIHSFIHSFCDCMTICDIPVGLLLIDWIYKLKFVAQY